MNYREAGQLNPILFITCLIMGMLCIWATPVAGADSNSGDVAKDQIKQGDATPDKSTPSDTSSKKAESPLVTGAADESKNDPLANIPTYGAALIRMVVALVSILIALLILAKLLPRWLNRSLRQKGKGDIAIVDSIQLEPRRRVYLLRVGDRKVLIGSSEQGLSTLVGELPTDEDDNGTSADTDLDSDATIIQPGHHPSSLATPFESVMKSKDGSNANLRENG